MCVCECRSTKIEVVLSSGPLGCGSNTKAISLYSDNGSWPLPRPLTSMQA